jgi:hypothetical protein
VVPDRRRSLRWDGRCGPPLVTELDTATDFLLPVETDEDALTGLNTAGDKEPSGDERLPRVRPRSGPQRGSRRVRPHPRGPPRSDRLRSSARVGRGRRNRLGVRPTRLAVPLRGTRRRVRSTVAMGTDRARARGRRESTEIPPAAVPGGLSHAPTDSTLSGASDSVWDQFTIPNATRLTRSTRLLIASVGPFVCRHRCQAAIWCYQRTIVRPRRWTSGGQESSWRSTPSWATNAAAVSASSIVAGSGADRTRRGPRRCRYRRGCRVPLPSARARRGRPRTSPPTRGGSDRRPAGPGSPPR